jgi:hypothetical protein
MRNGPRIDSSIPNPDLILLGSFKHAHKKLTEIAKLLNVKLGTNKNIFKAGLEGLEVELI